MSKVYTTEDLIQILRSERQACLEGKRLKLAVIVSGNPLIDQFIKTDGLQKFTAYQDFKAAIHEYQQEHQVSGIVWREITIREKTLRYPEVDAQLIALPNDIEILKSAKNSVIEFWRSVSLGLDFYLSINNSKEYRQITISDVDRMTQRTEWTSLWKWENPNFLEIVLQLGWGKPEEASYRRGFPASGSEYIHAVNPGNLPIG